MAEENLATPFGWPCVSAKFQTVHFLKKCEVYILVVDPSENGPVLYRLVEALNVKVFNRVCFENYETFGNA